MTEEIELRLLGETGVIVGGDLRLAGGQSSLLLSLLAARLNAVVMPSLLTGAIWPDGASRSALHQLISRLRKLLEPSESVRLETTTVGYRLVAPSDRVDLSCFEIAASRGRAALADGRPEDAEASFRLATTLWGEPFGPSSYHDELVIPANRLRELHATVEEELSEAILRRGNHAEEIDRFHRLVEEDPVRERRWCQLLVALYRSDRQTDALRCAHRARRFLADEIGVSPGAELERIEAAILDHDPSLLREPEPAGERFRLPADVTSFVGRDAECADLRQAILDHRVITVWGPGGVGKSRTVLRVVRELADGVRDGAVCVGLSALDDLSSVINALALAIGVTRHDHHDLANVVTHLSRCECYLVLDNCEHLSTEVATLVERILTDCPGVRVVVTSQQPLGILGERRWRLPLMSTRNDGAPSDAERLFVERALGDDPSAWDRLDVAALCERLDGLPLAVELAAALTPMLTPGEILDRLGDRFELLALDRDTTPGHHRTLVATIAWSHGLLSPPAATLLERVSVFYDGFTLEAAEAVCAGGVVEPAQVVGLLGELVGHSLVVARSTTTGTRYELLESIQLFAAHRLADAGDTEALALAHRQYFKQFARTHGRGVLLDDGQAIAALGADQENLRAALENAMAAGDDDDALDLANDLYSFWMLQGLTFYGRSRLEELLPGDTPASRRTAKAQLSAAVLAAFEGDFPVAERELSRARATFGELGLDKQVAWTSFWVGRSLTAAVLSGAQPIGRLEEAASHHLAAVRSFTSLGDDAAVLAVGPFAGLCWELCGDPAGRELIERSYQVAVALGFRRHVALAGSMLALTLARDGKLTEAIELLEAGMDALAEVGDRLNETIARGLHALVVLETGELEAATRQACDTIVLHLHHGTREWEPFLLAVGWSVLDRQERAAGGGAGRADGFARRLDLLVPNWTQPLVLAGFGEGVARAPVAHAQRASAAVLSELVEELGTALRSTLPG